MKALTILYADDDQDDLDLFCEAIKDFDNPITCITVMDGIQALDLLHNTTTDIVFLDLNMPRLDGFECLKQMKNDLSLKTIPVIIHSTSDRKKTECLAIGANDFIIKANNFNNIKENIFTILKKYL